MQKLCKFFPLCIIIYICILMYMYIIILCIFYVIILLLYCMILIKMHANNILYSNITHVRVRCKDFFTFRVYRYFFVFCLCF